MRALNLILAGMLCACSVAAQDNKDIPAFGKVDKSDLLLKECEFDKNAEAMILFETGEEYCSILSDVNFELVRHVRIKILNDKGLDHANVKIRYLSFKGLQKVKNFSAQTYNLDEAGNIVVSKVDKSAIFDKKITKRIAEQVFSFPNVKVGSVIEYKYTLDGSWEDWYFQHSIPVKKSRYVVDFPSELEVNSVAYGQLPVQAKTTEKGSRVIKTFNMTDIPALRDEPFISCEDDYLQRVETELIAINAPSRRYSLTKNWLQIIKDLMEDEDFGIQIKKNIPRTDDLDALLKTLKSPYDKMVAIHHYVRKNMTWDGIYSIWAMDGVRSAWKDKKGTAGEINMILVNLLKDAGLNAYPILVSTRSNGRVITTKPDWKQFDKVMAYVVIGEQVYVLDATDKFSSSKMIPLDVMYSEGLVISKLETGEWGWEGLWDDKQKFKNTTVFNAYIDENGVMNGEGFISSMDYARVKRMPVLKEGKDKFIQQFFTRQNEGVKIDSITIENEDVDSLPLNQKFKFTHQANSSGDYKYFSVNMFSGLEKNPFIADTRFSDVFFGYNQQHAVIASIIAPEDYTFESLPKNVKMIMPDTSIIFTRISAVQGQMLSVRMNLEFQKPFFSAADYPDFQEFYKKLFDMLNEQFVIKKKARP